jgi:fructan beta-fructosidase
MKTNPARNYAGQGMVEYALILLLIAVASLLVLQLSGISVRDVYCQVASGFSANACQQSTAYCQDGFDNPGGWQVATGAAGSWTTSNGQMCTNGTGSVTNTCSMAGLPSSNYVVEVTNAKLDKGNGYGVFFRVTNSSAGISGYAFQYDPGLSGVVIRKWVNGVEINPALAFKSLAGMDWYGAPHTLSVSVVGDTFIGMLDGNAVLTAKDSTYPTGGTGLRSWDSTSLCIDGFNINPIVP